MEDNRIEASRNSAFVQKQNESRAVEFTFAHGIVTCGNPHGVGRNRDFWRRFARSP
jgi:hypothetical protein